MRFKRILPIIVVLAALVLCSVSVSAADVVAEGTCGADGDNLTWVLDSDGVLTISGSGEMKNYWSSSEVPWYGYGSSIKTVVIENGVMSIGEDAFSGCSSLTSISIPDSVTSIGDYAFYKCSGLTSVSIPDGVTSIGDSAFYGTEYYNDEANWEDGALYIDNHLVDADWSISGEYTIKTGTKTIADYAFCYCDSLTSISIPDSVTSIGNYAFCVCSGLTSVSIPDSVTSIGRSAFSGTAYYNDEANWEDGVLYIDNHLIEADRYIISGEYTIKTGTKTIADSAFLWCDNLTAIVVDESNPYYRSQDGVLFDNDMKTLICFPGGKAGAYTIPDSVTSIGDRAFFECSSLISMSIPDSVTSIGNYAFYVCSGLTSVSIPDSVTSIGSGAFYYCSSLTSVSIPDSVMSIDWFAFYNCNSLADVYYSGSESDWGRIEIGEYNECLLNANIIFGVKDDIELVGVTTGTDRCSFMFKVAEDKVSKGKLFAAVYDAEGALIGVSSVEAYAQNLPLEVEIKGEPANCKAFLWDGMKPLAVNGKWEVEN